MTEADTIFHNYFMLADDTLRQTVYKERIKDRPEIAYNHTYDFVGQMMNSTNLALFAK